MNELIQRIFADFKVGGIDIPVSYLFYDGHGEPYVTYMQYDADQSYSGDDSMLGYVDYYDFDIYSKGNYLAIIAAVRALLEANHFVFQPSRSSADMYETDTGYYHKTLSFAYLRQED